MKPAKKEVDALFEEWMKEQPSARSIAARSAMAKKMNTPAMKAKVAVAQKKRFDSSKARHEHGLKTKLGMQKPGVLEKLVAATKKGVNTAANLKRNREAVTLAQNTPRLLALHKEVASRRVTCPHCGKEGGIMVMPRWHFDNCRNKP